MSDMRDTREVRNDKEKMEGNMPVEPERPREERRPMATKEPMGTNRDAMPVDPERPREERRPMPTTKEPIGTNRDAMPAQAATQAPAQMEMWPDMGEFRQRFEEIQSEFIEDPKSAVKKAEHLMEEAVERITKTMQERIQTMHRDVDGKDGDTEMLRLTMVGYRKFIDQMGSRRAA